MSFWPGMLRGACLCGKVKYELRGAPRLMYYCHCGTLEANPILRPSVHVYVASKAPWDRICDELPQAPEGYA